MSMGDYQCTPMDKHDNTIEICLLKVLLFTLELQEYCIDYLFFCQPFIIWNAFGPGSCVPNYRPLQYD